MCLSSSFIMSSSLAQLSAAFSVLLAAITHFTLAFFQRNKHSQRVTFAGQFLVCLGKFPLGSKLISGGVAIRMSWCAFFEKINSRGGTSIPDWRVPPGITEVRAVWTHKRFFIQYCSTKLTYARVYALLSPNPNFADGPCI